MIDALEADLIPMPGSVLSLVPQSEPAPIQWESGPEFVRLPDSESREGFESPRAGLFSQIGPTAESTVLASSGAVQRLVGAESHGGHAALAAIVEQPTNSPQPNEPVTSHTILNLRQNSTLSLGRDGLSQVAPEVLQEPGDADIHDPEGIVQDHLIGEMRINPAFRRGLESMDHVDLRARFHDG